ncbi:MAG: hypothetical protein LBO00_01735 [Zoogloeaceae bacterium]|jgi:hypothetical protein|nr:hypothetical protein [Zoogloeaceae bacterium]
MSKAIIIIEDAGEEIAVSINFGENGICKTSEAHHAAVIAMQAITQSLREEDDDGQG